MATGYPSTLALLCRTLTSTPGAAGLFPNLS